MQAGIMHAVLVNITTRFCSSSSPHWQLKHHHCYALHFEYEHKPVFEEGQRLSSRLLDSLSSTDSGAEKERYLPPHVVSKQPSKRIVGHSSLHKRTPHLSMEKKHSMRAKVSQPARTDASGNCGEIFVEDSDLFSFDDIPLYEVDDDDDVNDIVDGQLEHSSSMSSNANAQASSIPSLKAEQNLSTQMSAYGGYPATKHDGDSYDADPELEHLNLVDVLIESNGFPQDYKHTPRKSQPIKLSSESVCFGEVKTENCAYKADAHGVELDYNNQFMVGNAEDDGHHVVSLASHEMDKFPLQQQSLVDNISSGSFGKFFNPLQFARSYNLVGLRVSLAECKNLAYRLKGHLLNWPRVSNIARVEGDDMDWDMMSLRPDGKGGSNGYIEDSLLQAVYGTVISSGDLMKHAKSAKRLSSHQYRFLEYISRPGSKVSGLMKTHREGQVTKRKQYRKRYHMVELGMSFESEKLCSRMNNWRGPFCLLLLDPKYAGQCELPRAVQMLQNEYTGHEKRGPRREIVPCRLTLFYDYWSLEEIINHLLPTGETSPLPIKILGHIAVLQLREQYSSVKYLMARVILDKHRPRVKTVINKYEPVEDHGHPSLEILAGNHSVVTSIIENDMQFLLNLATVPWDSELAVERQRLVQTFSTRDIVCDVFAGAGTLALLSAKKVWRVFANDPITDALKYLERNVTDNKLQAKVELYNLDCCVFVKKLLAFMRPVLMTQIVFSLPTSVETVISALKGAFNRETWPANQPLPMVHVYGHNNTLHPEIDFSDLIVDKLGLVAEAVELHVVKPLNSGRWLVCASFRLPERLAFYDW